MTNSTQTNTDQRDSGVMRRETAAYWFAAGKGADNATCWRFSRLHKTQARAYWISETLAVLPSVPDAWEDFQQGRLR